MYCTRDYHFSTQCPLMHLLKNIYLFSLLPNKVDGLSGLCRFQVQRKSFGYRYSRIRCGSNNLDFVVERGYSWAGGVLKRAFSPPSPSMWMFQDRHSFLGVQESSLWYLKFTKSDWILVHRLWMNLKFTTSGWISLWWWVNIRFLGCKNHHYDIWNLRNLIGF